MLLHHPISILGRLLALPADVLARFPSYELPFLLIWDFQYDSYLSVSCRFGLLAYHWVPCTY